MGLSGGCCDPWRPGAVYEPAGKHVRPPKAPWDFGIPLIPLDDCVCLFTSRCISFAAISNPSLSANGSRFSAKSSPVTVSCTKET